MAKPTIIYGGPYAHETDAINAESTRKNPNYDELVSGWNTISQGAHDFIESLKKPVEAPDGPFVENVKIDYDKEDNYIPKTADFDNGRPKLKEEGLVEDSDVENTNGAGGDEIPTPKDVVEGQSEVKGQSEVDLDKL